MKQVTRVTCNLFLENQDQTTRYKICVYNGEMLLACHCKSHTVPITVFYTWAFHSHFLLDVVPEKNRNITLNSLNSFSLSMKMQFFLSSFNLILNIATLILPAEKDPLYWSLVAVCESPFLSHQVQLQNNKSQLTSALQQKDTVIRGLSEVSPAREHNMYMFVFPKWPLSA